MIDWSDVVKIVNDIDDTITIHKDWFFSKRALSKILGISHSSLCASKKGVPENLKNTLLKQFSKNLKEYKEIPFEVALVIARYYAYESSYRCEKAKEFYLRCNESVYIPNQKTVKKAKTVSNRKGSYIYLFEGVNVLKVGFSTNVEDRLKTLERWPGELKLLLKIKGTLSQEKKIHKRLHKNGESLGLEWYPLDRKEEIVKILKDLVYKKTNVTK